MFEIVSVKNNSKFSSLHYLLGKFDLQTMESSYSMREGGR